MHSSLEIAIVPDSLQGALRIRVRGSLTRRTAPRLIAFLERRAYLPDCPDLVVNLCGLDRVDPEARDLLTRHVAEHNQQADASSIDLDLPLSQGSTAARPDAPAEVEDVGGPAAIRARDLMSPIGAMISCTQTLREAAERMPETGCVLVLGLSHQPQGILPRDLLHRVRQSGDPDWGRRLCTSAEETFAGSVSADAPPPDDLDDGPLVVLEGEDPVGVLFAASVTLADSQTGGRR